MISIGYKFLGNDNKNVFDPITNKVGILCKVKIKYQDHRAPGAHVLGLDRRVHPRVPQDLPEDVGQPARVQGNGAPDHPSIFLWDLTFCSYNFGLVNIIFVSFFV
ncbi:MAG: hypothetical protein RBG13Loki_1610 [Promethearchaeota archaeon CR_4]|nr:MAG: hypothetical protein RBG13Loki_1610 [Candidatus Lokiarchaeota archaeon CR_4]